LSISRRVVGTLATLSLSAVAVFALAAPAHAFPPANVAFSAPTVAPGEYVTYSVTTGVDVLFCAYVDGALYAPSSHIVDTNITDSPIAYEELVGGFPDITDYTLVVTTYPGDCAATKTEALVGAFSSSSLSVLAPAPAPAPVPAPVEPTLAVTGANPAAPLAIAGFLLLVGAGIVANRRRVAKN
jgi:hypothetical protein